MKLTFLANACCLYEYRGFRILSDPWLVDGAFEGAWFHWPPLKTKPEDLKDVDALYISHIHPDHFSKDTLKVFRRDIPIIILNQEPNYLLNALKREGFTNFVKIGDQKSCKLGPFELTMYKAWCLNPWITGDMGNPLDSALVLETDSGVSVFNSNDATPTLKACFDLRDRHGTFTVAQLQFNGAGPYPSCFAFNSPEETRAEHERMIERNRHYLIEMQNALCPTYVMPFAGQYLIGGKNWHKNFHLGTTTTHQASWDSSLFSLYLEEGQTVDLMTIRPSFPLPAKIDERGAMLEYAYSLRDKPYTYASDPYPNHYELEILMRQAIERVKAKLESLKIDLQCSIKVNGKVVHNDPKSHNILVAHLDNRLLLRILNGAAHWNNAEIGCHIEFVRTGPYCPDAHMALSYLSPRGV